MSKSVLVIDTPESCAQCPLLNGSDECVMQDASANFNTDSFDDLMHGCPLKPLPEKKEMTAREFVEWYINMRSLCKNRICAECVLSEKNTKCNRNLCNTCNWKGNIDELLEIAKSGIQSPEVKAIDTLEKIIKNPNHVVVNDEFVESLKLAVEKLKEVV